MITLTPPLGHSLSFNVPVSSSLPAVRQIDKRLKALPTIMEVQWIQNPCQRSSHLRPAAEGVGGGERELVGIEPCSARLPVRYSGGKAERARTPRGALEFQPVQDAPGRDHSARDWRLLRSWLTVAAPRSVPLGAGWSVCHGRRRPPCW